ncbi:hypothetical protein BU14_0871s0003 [Porphyra umbilicalis]|uniref:Uncharacterized protein n=1 Tax=Porphyra umbilicalis TaxID=2786 RepID=A0A1X6NNI9_PORUM|nr:hypothetical protein BU14_0871s0003 [Porphyra umbilicalis]|eukprot:OSX70181.1 hypothetical protein BU14_0871s0003 [Porphyra umbilicalis]
MTGAYAPGKARSPRQRYSRAAVSDARRTTAPRPRRSDPRRDAAAAVAMRPLARRRRAVRRPTTALLVGLAAAAVAASRGTHPLGVHARRRRGRGRGRPPPGSTPYHGRAVYVGAFGAAASNPRHALDDHLWALAAYLAACGAGADGGYPPPRPPDGDAEADAAAPPPPPPGAAKPLWLVFGALPKAAAEVDLEAPLDTPAGGGGGGGGGVGSPWAAAAALVLAAYVVPRERVFFREDVAAAARCFEGGVYALRSQVGGGEHAAFRGLAYDAWDPTAPAGAAGAGAAAGANGTAAAGVDGGWRPMSPAAKRAGLSLLRAALAARFHLDAGPRGLPPPPRPPPRGASWRTKRTAAAAAAAYRHAAVASPPPVSLLLDARGGEGTLRWEGTAPLVTRLRGMRRVAVGTTPRASRRGPLPPPCAPSTPPTWSLRPPRGASPTSLPPARAPASSPSGRVAGRGGTSRTRPRRRARGRPRMGRSSASPSRMSSAPSWRTRRGGRSPR